MYIYILHFSLPFFFVTLRLNIYKAKALKVINHRIHSIVNSLYEQNNISSKRFDSQLHDDQIYALNLFPPLPLTATSPHPPLFSFFLNVLTTHACVWVHLSCAGACMYVFMYCLVWAYLTKSTHIFAFAVGIYRLWITCFKCLTHIAAHGYVLIIFSACHHP